MTMTMTADQYIVSVVGNLPRAMPERKQIEMELRSLIAERVERGQSLDDVIRQLGDPRTLADSYLAAVPLVPGKFMHRAAAKIVDFLAFGVLFAPIGWMIGRLIEVPFFAPIIALILTGLFLGIYTVFAEWQFGETIGKRMLGLRVVRESGGRIGFGQALV